MSINFDSLNILDFIAAAIVALILWFLDKQKRPHLVIDSTSPSELNLPQGKYKILNLIVKNIKETGWRGLFNQTATQVRATLYYKDFDAKKEIFQPQPVIARWNTTREPLTPEYNKVDVGLALTNPREVIAPGEEITLSVAIKKDKATNCYPFNNESYLYLPDYAKPDWELIDDKFIVSATVKTAETGEKCSNFVVINKKGLSQFSIAKSDL